MRRGRAQDAWEGEPLPMKRGWLENSVFLAALLRIAEPGKWPLSAQELHTWAQYAPGRQGTGKA